MYMYAVHYIVGSRGVVWASTVGDNRVPRFVPGPHKYYCKNSKKRV